MLTVTMGRSVSVLSIAAAVAVGSATASAQVIITSNGSSVVGNAVGTMVRRAITVSDDSVRSYLTRFEPAVLEDESGDANIVTMVLDNDGTYVRSTTRHAKVMQAMPGRVIAVNGDGVRTIGTGEARVFTINGDSLRASGAGETRVFTINGDSVRALTAGSGANVSVATLGGAVVAVNTMHRTEGDSPSMLAGLAPDEVGGIATKHYAAGEMGKGPVFVTFIYLK
jgi:hypothetical protein